MSKLEIAYTEEYSIETPKEILVADPYFYNDNSTFHTSINELYSKENFGYEFNRKINFKNSCLIINQYTFNCKNPKISLPNLLVFNEAKIMLLNYKKTDENPDEYIAIKRNNNLTFLTSKSKKYEIIVDEKIQSFETSNQNNYGYYYQPLGSDSSILVLNSKPIEVQTEEAELKANFDLFKDKILSLFKVKN